ncbi:hypothetical protein GCM10022392_14250 [Mucilaginibacter panaciglaebae]|uniref:BZIP transcription factor n=1 Tax=Mucilaginibacter panaciglaebae TaxID=502331 RepID=A0ABP7WNR9_9SPHI
MSLDSYNTGTNKNVLSITQGGFLGIGYTTDPTSGNLFAVNGKSYFGNNISIVQSGNITPGVGSTYGLRVYNGSSEQATVGYDASYVYLQSWSSKPLQINNLGNNTIINSSSGNVGIGTPTPAMKLHIAGSGISTDTQWIELIDPQANSGTSSSLLLGQSNGVSAIQVGASNNLTIQPTGGNVLIGQTTQANPAYKLDVNGSARVNEVVVNSTGADFVFEKKYKLTTLSEVKTYIDENHHLPQIPSAKEMEKNGLSVGEMNTKLLQKVEELTLYLIEKDKQLSNQQQNIKAQQKQINELKEQLKNIAKSLPKN